MGLITGLGKRLRAALRPSAADGEMSEELAFHLQMETEKYIRAGMSPAEARRMARITFGGVESVKEDLRSRRGLPWLAALAQDLRHAVRDIRRAPGFAAVAIATLGLGIGAATVIFSVVNAVVLAPPPFPEADRLIHAWETNPEHADFSTSEPNFLDFRARNRTLADLAAYRVDNLSLTGNGEPQRLVAVAVTRSFFPVLGASPILGRTSSAEEDRPGGARVAVLSHALWQRAFGADSSVVGRAITLKAESFTVIGVMPAAFRFQPADLWVPIAPSPAADRGDHWLGMIGKLRPGATAAQAQDDLARVAAENGVTYPGNTGWSVRVSGLDRWLVETPIRQSGLLLLAAVGVLLLMACTNVANLLLARATARQTDLSVRLALGAGRSRLLRQLLTESAVLALLGALAGLALTVWAVSLLRALPAGLVPRLDTVAVDGRVLAFALGMAVAASLMVGLLPALQASNSDIHSVLKQAGRTGSTGGRHGVRDVLVVGQVALAVLLLVGGGLMVRSLIRIQNVDAGLAVEHVWTVPLQLPTTQYPEEWQLARFYNVVTGRLATIPGVRSAGATIVDPYQGQNLVNGVTPEDRAADYPTGDFLQAAWRVVSPGYFESAGVRVMKGRDFAAEDTFEGGPVTIVSQTLAARAWPGQDPIGKRLFWGGTDGKPRTVIGLVSDIRDVSLTTEVPPILFLTTRQMVWPAMTLVIRGDREMPTIAADVRRTIWAEDPNLPVPAVRPMTTSRANATTGPRFTAWLLGAFAVAALGLAMIGLYGVLSFAVVARTREIGIRITLGAEPRDVVAMLVRRGLRLTGAGVVLGLAGALVLTRLMTGLLYQTAGTDPVILVAVPILLGAVALAAAFGPATRASRVDPLTALRG